MGETACLHVRARADPDTPPAFGLPEPCFGDQRLIEAGLSVLCRALEPQTIPRPGSLPLHLISSAGHSRGSHFIGSTSVHVAECGVIVNGVVSWDSPSPDVRILAATGVPVRTARFMKDRAVPRESAMGCADPVRRVLQELF